MPEYDKLVRDDIPRVIRENDDRPVTHRVEGEAYEDRLVEKLREETAEFREERDPAELADVLEVVEALVETVGREEVERLRAEKAAERGRFDEGVVLDRVIEAGENGDGRNDDSEKGDGESDDTENSVDE